LPGFEKKGKFDFKFRETHSDAFLDSIFPEIYWFKFNKWICSGNLRT
jgi:hypothetical protein